MAFLIQGQLRPLRGPLPAGSLEVRACDRAGGRLAGTWTSAAGNFSLSLAEDGLPGRPDEMDVHLHPGRGGCFSLTLRAKESAPGRPLEREVFVQLFDRRGRRFPLPAADRLERFAGGVGTTLPLLERDRRAYPADQPLPLRAGSGLISAAARQRWGEALEGILGQLPGAMREEWQRWLRRRFPLFGAYDLLAADAGGVLRGDVESTLRMCNLLEALAARQHPDLPDLPVFDPGWPATARREPPSPSRAGLSQLFDPAVLQLVLLATYRLGRGEFRRTNLYLRSLLVELARCADWIPLLEAAGDPEGIGREWRRFLPCGEPPPEPGDAPARGLDAWIGERPRPSPEAERFVGELECRTLEVLAAGRGPVPTYGIESIEPADARPGEAVVLRGHGFGGREATVGFTADPAAKGEEAEAQARWMAADRLEAVVPAAARWGAVSLRIYDRTVVVGGSAVDLHRVATGSAAYQGKSES